jgi:DNA processing protein
MHNVACLSYRFGVSPWREMGAYEALWSQRGATFKTIADKFRANPAALPSDLVTEGMANKFAEDANEILQRAKITNFGVRVHGAAEYPVKLRVAEHPVELLYYQGWWDLVNSPCVAIVGTREPSPKAVNATTELVRNLVKDKLTIASGLAKGIDSVAHKTAIESGGFTIGVIGTALSQSYPAVNKELQAIIGRDFLLISQVPVVRSSNQGPNQNRVFFPERNITMSALTEATIIMEAGETSGTLTQARAALKQKRKLLIWCTCFENEALTWPKRFEAEGAKRVSNYDDVKRALELQS